MDNKNSPPSSEDANANRTTAQDEKALTFATYHYPQMGGYCGLAMVTVGGPGACFDAHIWHNGEFPFGYDDDEPPTRMHHCKAEQFIEFGLLVMEKQAGSEMLADKYFDLDVLSEFIQRIQALQEKLKDRQREK